MPSTFSIQAEEELNDRLLDILPNKVKNIIDEILEADNVIEFIVNNCITFFDGYNYKKYIELN